MLLSIMTMEGIEAAENVREVLTDYRDAIRFVLNQTLRGMNKGLTPDELVQFVRLPASLANREYFREYYGTVEWSVRSIYCGYLGWFDGNSTNLYPLPPVEEAERIVKLAGGEEKIMNQIKEAIALKDYQWACQLADYIIALDPESREVKLLKAKALTALTEKQINSNARHYYL